MMKKIGSITHQGKRFIIYAAQQEFSSTESRSDDCLWKKFEWLVETHFRKQRNRQFYAQALYISSVKLDRLCKTNSAMSPSAYILRRILREAEHLLNDTSLQLKEISFTLGFTQQSNFTQYFRLYKGISPGAYRQRE